MFCVYYRVSTVLSRSLEVARIGSLVVWYCTARIGHACPRGWPRGPEETSEVEAAFLSAMPQSCDEATCAWERERGKRVEDRRKGEREVEGKKERVRGKERKKREKEGQEREIDREREKMQ